MNKLDELINELTNSQSVIKYKKLEKIINTNKTISQQYQELLQLQKAMVQSENDSTNNNIDAQIKYNNHIDTLMNNPVISEYLSALEEVNEDLNLLQMIIEQEINEELK